MAKKKKEEAEDSDGGGKKGMKKLVIMIVVIMLIGGFVAKTILLKPKPLTASQVAAAAALANTKLENLCASHNDLPTQSLPTETPPKGSKVQPATTTTTIADAPAPAGPVDTLDSITINLAAGHYLKIGLALQVPAGMDPTTVKDTENWEAVALKTVIDTLSGQTLDTLSAQREIDENNIGDSVCRKTDGKVLTIYFTDFVMQ
ncbi:MAG: flagellar basal body-associated protein FliL [Acidimicrobiia bacterium]